MHKIKKVLLIGAGPVVIGRAAEYDYSASQAIAALKEEGIKVVAVNSNPSTIMTDKDLADAVYIGALTSQFIKEIIKKEKPDALLPTMGGEITMEIGLELDSSGFLEENGVRLIGIDANIIYTLSNKQAFIDFLSSIDEPYVPWEISGSVEAALDFALEVSYPVIVRPAYNLGGTNASICKNAQELEKAASEQLQNSPIEQILTEKSIAGWKEIEFEVVRDSQGTAISISSMENIDPVGIHTGDSIVVIPAQTLTDSEASLLRSSALNIADSLGICGSCNVKFALKPNSDAYAVISATPGVGRSSALVSKATGYPIARVSAKLAADINLPDIKNEITNSITACNEPSIDYCVVKMPKWSFDSLSDSDRRLGTAMSATGEAIAIGTSFELAFMKGIRSVNSGMYTPSLMKISDKSDDELIEIISESDDERIFAVYLAIKRVIPFNVISSVTGIDKWFLSKLKNIADMEKSLAAGVDERLYMSAKKIGFLDAAIEEISGAPLPIQLFPGFKMVDTCAAEFDAVKPYFYSAWDDDNEALLYEKANPCDKKKILIVAAGPAFIGQGIDLDYCVVHTAKALSEQGYQTIIVNNNPQSVSTDYSTADKLYIEPLTQEDILGIVNSEKPYGAVLQFAGKTAPRLAETLENAGVKILGAAASLMTLAENTSYMNVILEKLGISHNSDLRGKGIELYVISDGERSFVPAIIEHIEKTGVNFDDSIAVYPVQTVSEKMCAKAKLYAQEIAAELGIKGMLNIAFVIYDNRLYVTRISPGHVRLLPFAAKATGLDLASLAAKCMSGERLGDFEAENNGGVFVKVPVFSFNRSVVSEKSQSTGEVMAFAPTFKKALLKALKASGMRIKTAGGVFITAGEYDKIESINVADKFLQMDFNIYATAKTANLLNSHCVPASAVRKAHEDSPNIADLIRRGKIAYLISTSAKGEQSVSDDKLIRRMAVQRGIPTFTSLDTAQVFVDALSEGE